MYSFDKICCLCLKNKIGLANLHNLDSDNIIIRDKLNYCLPELTNDVINNQTRICSICHDRINSFYDFKNTALQNYKNLLSYIKDANQSDINKPIQSKCVYVKTENSSEETNNIFVTKEQIEINKNNTQKSEDSSINQSLISESIKKEITEEKIIIDVHEEDKSNYEEDPETEQTLTNTSSKKFACSHCNKKFSSNRYLQTHMQHHTGEKFCVCLVCNKQCSSKPNLKVHLRIHSDNKPFPCILCPKKYSQKTHLTNHLRNHAGVKPYNCSLCPKNFVDETYLKKHLKVHSSEKPFSCSVCKKPFARKFYLKNHLKTHNKSSTKNMKIS